MSIVGCTEFIDINSRYKHVPSKVDTGADTSSIWASDIKINKQGNLEYKLFAKQSDLYDGHVFKIKKGNFTVKFLHTSTGEENIRYQVVMPIVLAKHKFKASFTLADRSKNSMPVLIGRRALTGKFLVDVQINNTKRTISYDKDQKKLRAEFEKNPHKFHNEYIEQEKI